jgi:uncharacterized protein (TIGR02421 family)
MPSERQKTQFPPRLLQAVRDRLVANRRVRRVMPVWGRLHIDRQLPFLFVYRQPPGLDDAGTERLLQGQASYLMVSGKPGLQRGIRLLVGEIASSLVPFFGSFLIVEVWSARGNEQEHLATRTTRPSFRLVAPQNNSLVSTTERLDRALRRVRISKTPAEVTVTASSRVAPPGLQPLLRAPEARRLGAHLMGLEIAPIHQDAASGDLYPLVLRRLQRGLTRALEQGVFEFSRKQTTHFPPHYRALGRRAVVKAVWDVDQRLADVSDAFDFLLHVTPTNADRAWAAFRRAKCEKAPLFRYRPLPAEPGLLKRELYKVPIERVEDPSIQHLLLEKQTELDRKITMLADRGTPRFVHGSAQLFGEIDAETQAFAMELLERVPPRTRDDKARRYLRAEEFAPQAEAEIAWYRDRDPGFRARVEVREDISGLMVSRGALLIGKRTKVPASRVSAVLQHEVGTHLVTYFNGRAQPFKQLYSGLAGYEEFQEGLAVLAEYLSGGLTRPRLRTLAIRVLVVRMLLEGADFVEAFREVNGTHGFERRSAFTIVMRAFRAGGLTKDAVYLKGFIHLVNQLREGAQLGSYFIGKISARQVPIIEELLWRKVLRPAPLIPRFLQKPNVQESLTRLTTADSLMQELTGR